MSYGGQIATIQCGQGGLHTDDPQSTIPMTDVIRAVNVTTYNNVMQKSPSSQRYNTTIIPSGVMAMFDWWPDDTIANRRLCVVGGDGKVYFITSTGTILEITNASTPTLTAGNQIYMVSGGNLAADAPRLLFIMDGIHPVQVISGAGATTRTDMSGPDAAWGTNKHPTYGIVHHGRMCLMGVSNAPHILYMSASANHQTFTGSDQLTFNVYPGEGTRLMAAFVFGGRLYLVKKPYHAYYLDDSDNTNAVFAANWSIRKASSSLSCASAHAIVPILNDVWIKNSADQIESVATVKEFGDIKSGEVLNVLRMEQFMRDNTSKDGMVETHGLYYAEKKLVYFTYRSSTGTSNDNMVEMRVEPGKTPKATLITKDAPNCLALMRDTSLIPRPIYGSLDGYVYLMDQSTGYNVNGTGYVAEFQTPHMDFGTLSKANNLSKDQHLAEINKIYDFLELRVSPLGNWPLYADIFIDGDLYETITIQLTGDALLGAATAASGDFMLSETSTDPLGSLLGGQLLVPVQVPLHGCGRTISVRLYNTGLDQGFQISSMFIGFRAGGQEASVNS